MKKDIYGTTIKKFLFCLISTAVLIVIYKVLSLSIKKDILYDAFSGLNKTSIEILYDCSVIQDGRNYVFEGKVASFGKEILDVQLAVLNEQDKEIYLAEMNELDGIDIDFSKEIELAGYAFQASVPSKKIENDVVYEVGIKILCESSENDKNTEKHVIKQLYFYNGSVYSYNPHTVTVPTFLDETMLQVISDGELSIYDSNMQMWVYTYDDELFWIFKKNMNNIKNLYIPVHLYTYFGLELADATQERDYINNDFYFRDNQYNLSEQEMYAVAKMSIPENQVITHIRTGVYNVEMGTWVTQFVLQNNSIMR